MRQIFTAKYRIEAGVFIPDPNGPVPWKGGIIPGVFLGDAYALHPDGERVLVRTIADANEVEQTFDHVVLFENFFEHVRKQVPTE